MRPRNLRRPVHPLNAFSLQPIPAWWWPLAYAIRIKVKPVLQ